MSSYGLLALIGSGEFSDSMAEVHRQIMSWLDGPIRPVFIDTPAGFELNIDAIDEKAVAYFKRHFNQELAIARYRSLKDPAEKIAAAVSAIRRANYIMAGPGSPSYALRVWRESPIWDAIVDCWRSGAILVFASAASLILGVRTIPVYEIYKVGDDPYWRPGLNLLREIGLNTVVVPHWNNSSGDQHDTRFCFIGEPRFESLQAELDPNTTVLGIDEYTALLIDTTQRQAEVFGAGTITVRGYGQEVIYNKGHRFNIDYPTQSARNSRASDNKTPEPDPALATNVARISETTQLAIKAGNIASIREGLLALSLIASIGLKQGTLDRTATALEALNSLLPTLSDIADNRNKAEHWREERNILLDLIVTARAELRKAKLWSVADRLRDQLADLNYVLLDTPQGTLWQR